jgi:hypothetical protein
VKIDNIYNGNESLIPHEKGENDNHYDNLSTINDISPIK